MAQEERHRIRAWWAELFRAVDVVLAPAAPTVAIAHDHRPIRQRRLVVDGAERPYWDLLVWASAASLAYLPVTAVPLARSAGGLPIGAQVIGAHGEDRTTLAFAERAEAVLGGFTPPPEDESGEPGGPPDLGRFTRCSQSGDEPGTTAADH